jgi:hypothetical protein
LGNDSVVPPIVTSLAVVTCVHGGMVTLIPTQTAVSIQGGQVLCEPDLLGAPILGCPVPPTPTTKPCTTVVATFPGSTSLKVLVGGRPPYIATLAGVTDGVPPGTILVSFPGQVVVQA